MAASRKRERCTQASARLGATIVSPSTQVAEIQRSRLAAGALRAVDELGYSRATVSDITARARVSRRTFYELFSNYEDCIAMVLESAVERMREQIVAAVPSGLVWRERVRGGLWGLLSLLDREPALARVCVVQSARGGQRILERREHIFAGLAIVLDEGRKERVRPSDFPALTAEGLVGGALSILHTRLLRGDSGPLTDLQGDLMAMIVLPYLGAAAARAERERKTPVPAVIDTAHGNGKAHGVPGEANASDASADPLQSLPMRLTYRTVRVLEAVAQKPGISNRGVGDEAGISDQGQISKLMARLQRYDLLENKGQGRSKGEPNAWYLTAVGRSVAGAVALDGRNREQPPNGSVSGP